MGRPNAGKSSLVNAILRDRRTIVSNVAGTTRDAIDVPYLHDGQPYVLIDTAGMRPPLPSGHLRRSFLCHAQ